MSYEPIFANKAYVVMQQQHISRQEVFNTFYSKNLESFSIPGATQVITHLTSKTVGCIYKKNGRDQ